MNKTAIKNYAVWARRALIEAVEQKAYEYGITDGETPDGMLEAVGGRPLTKNEKDCRRKLIEEISRKNFNQVMEETAYTWFNRFIALRYMEVNGFIPSRVRVFTNEAGEFKPDILKEAMTVEIDGIDRNIIIELLEKQNNEELFKYLIITQCNALNQGLPYMFKKISDYTELLFPSNLLRPDSVIGKMIEDIPEEDWQDAVQIIGWLYQYYNTELKDETFAALKKNIKISKEKIPAATQLFTPDWIVRYMVENSVGRIYINGQLSDKGEITEQERIEAEKAIAEQMGWKYYLPEAEQTKEVRIELNSLSTNHYPLSTIKLIDPCMGSGHILVYAFDVLMDIYTQEGYSERDAAQSILQNNIYGLDIDNRAAQLAYFAVMMKARHYDRRIFTRGIQPHLYAITESNNLDSNAVDYFTNNDYTLIRDFGTLIAKFRDAKEYGSVLNVPQVDFAALYARVEEVKSDISIFNEQVTNEILPLIQVAEVLAQKYDVVVTNPPYMGSSGMGNKLSDFVKKNYPDSNRDLFAVFIERCGEMIKQNGYQAMITQHVWMFLSSYEKLRSKMLNSDIVNMAHLGARAFEEIGGEVVQTTSFVIRKSRVANYKGEYCRLIDPTTQQGKEDMFLKGENRYQTDQSNFSKIPGSPVAYWVGEKFIANFEHGISIDDISDFTGSQHITADNDRFLRLHWEVNSSSIAKGKKWAFYAKGGEYRKWYGNIELIVKCDDISMRFYRENHTSNCLDEKYWYTPGITYSAITSIGTGFRYYPPVGAFDKGGATACQVKHFEYVLAVLNSKIAKIIFNFINPTINLQVRDVKAMPIIFQDSYINEIKNLSNTNIETSKSDYDSYETSWDFKRCPLV